jgi:hypothetical protein
MQALKVGVETPAKAGDQRDRAFVRTTAPDDVRSPDDEFLTGERLPTPQEGIISEFFFEK